MLDRELRFIIKGLKDHAIALCELHQRRPLLLRQVALDLEAETDVAEADGSLLGHAQRAAVERKNAASDRLAHVSGFLQNTRIVADRAAAAEVVGTASAALDAANARLSACPSAASALAGHVGGLFVHVALQVVDVNAQAIRLRL